MVSTKTIQTATLLSLAVAFGAYTFEAVTYPGIIRNYLGVNSLILLLPAVLLFSYLRFFKEIPQLWTKTAFIASQVTLYLGIMLLLLDQIFYINYVYSTVGIYPFSVLKIGVLLSIFAAISLNLQYIKQIKTPFYFLLPLWAFGLMFALKIHSETIFYEITKEDSLVEYATMIGYLVITFLGYKSLRILLRSTSLKKYTKWLYGGIYIVVILGSFLVAGEEISWGERIIGFQAPQSVTEKNTQSEFNIHNNFAVFGYVYYAYGLVALYGTVALVIQRGLAKIIPVKTITKFLYFFAPPFQTFSFFLPMLIFIILRFYFGNTHTLNQWEEFTELVLVIGLALFFYRNYTLLRNNKKSLQKVLG